jgi:hypothetical protein
MLVDLMLALFIIASQIVTLKGQVLASEELKGMSLPGKGLL